MLEVNVKLSAVTKNFQGKADDARRHSRLPTSRPSSSPPSAKSQPKPSCSYAEAAENPPRATFTAQVSEMLEEGRKKREIMHFPVGGVRRAASQYPISFAQFQTQGPCFTGAFIPSRCGNMAAHSLSIVEHFARCKEGKVPLQL
jgi:hypothetical protein